MLAGDITGDGSCGHGFQNALILLLTFLESKKVQTFFIKGNHDENKFFGLVMNMTKDFQYVERISSKIIQFKEIKFLGLDFDDTESITRLNDIILHNSKVNFILAHCSWRRRIRLLDFDTNYIITGHFNENIGYIEDKVFISIGNERLEDINFVTINLTKSGEKITFYNMNCLNDNVKLTNAIKNKNNFSMDIASSDITDNKFSQSLSIIRNIKNKEMNEITQYDLEQIRSIISLNSMTFFTDYLGRSKYYKIMNKLSETHS